MAKKAKKSGRAPKRVARGKTLTDAQAKRAIDDADLIKSMADGYSEPKPLCDDWGRLAEIVLIRAVREKDYDPRACPVMLHLAGLSMGLYYYAEKNYEIYDAQAVKALESLGALPTTPQECLQHISPASKVQRRMLAHFAPVRRDGWTRDYLLRHIEKRLNCVDTKKGRTFDRMRKQAGIEAAEANGRGRLNMLSVDDVRTIADSANGPAQDEIADALRSFLAELGH